MQCSSGSARRAARAPRTLAMLAGDPAAAPAGRLRRRALGARCCWQTPRLRRSVTHGSAASTCCSRYPRAGRARCGRARLARGDRSTPCSRASPIWAAASRFGEPARTPRLVRSIETAEELAASAGRPQADDGDLLLGLARESSRHRRELLGPATDEACAPAGARRSLSRARPNFRVPRRRIPQVRDGPCRCPSQRASETPEGSDILDSRTRRAPLRECSRE